MFMPYFVQMQQWSLAWKTAVDEHMARLEQWNGEWASAEARTMERANEAIDEAAKLFKASLRYTHELSSAWRKQSAEASRQAASVIGA